MLRILFYLPPFLMNIVTGLLFFVPARRLAAAGIDAVWVGAAMSAWALTYTITSAFTTSKGFQGAAEYWFRSSHGTALDEANKNFSFLSTEGGVQNCKFQVTPRKETMTIYLTLLGGVGQVQFLDLTITPAALTVKVCEPVPVKV